MTDGSISISRNSVAGGDGPLGHAVGAARQGAADASEAAERFVASARLFTARLVYTTCYTISYGLVFPTMVVARAIPRDNSAVRGLIDGAGAATRKAESMLSGAPAPLALTGD
jgi:hypothetical protein